MDDLVQSQDPNDNAQTKPNQAQATGASALPTPVSIPRKKTVPRNLVDSTARVLFPSRTDAVDDSMPTPRKNRRGKKNVGFSLYSSMEDDGTSSEDRIQIFTDSKDKVPELDMSKDNPFIERPQEQSPQPEPVKSRSSRRKRTSPHIQSNPQIEEAFNRDQGMVYVFRGKKIYRKFPQDSDSEDEVTEPEDSTAEAPHRPLTRSSIKPRLLFPTAQQRAQRSAAAIAEEEAPTDIEDHTQKLVTPVKQSFGPATPPTTGHVTRSATKAQRDLTVSPPGTNEPASGPPPSWKGRSSPFSDWSRKKPGVQSSRIGKREGDLLERDDAKGPKKSKTHATD
ncbi:MAG: hypothetical protein OHK93_004824 [Ramalina farinacea]|uniref:Uncharacterized protein n=1 Tax=Ramalina farinacea TaxID=258253 RepID=A0AA43QZB5_9LECA|nr:hypothetical protein [Ramalina farinacea]